MKDYDPNCVSCRYTRPGGPSHAAHICRTCGETWDRAYSRQAGEPICAECWDNVVAATSD